MDAKITKKRLNILLSYDWIKIIGLAVGIIFVWVLVFTMTATRVMESQRFIISSYIGNVSGKAGLHKSLQTAQEENKFTHELLEFGVDDLGANDASTAHQLLQARTTTNEFDLMFVSQENNPSTKVETTDENGNKTTTYTGTYIQDFLMGYRYEVFKVDEYLADMATFVNGYYEGETLDESKVEADFRARVKRMKDKRYKTEDQIKAGIQGEKDRVEKYKKALADFNEYVERGYVRIETISYEPEKPTVSDVAWSGAYAINLCPDTKTMGKLSDFVGYQTTYKDENDKEQTAISAENMCVCLFDSNGEEECYRYDGLVYITALIDSVLKAA